MNSFTKLLLFFECSKCNMYFHFMYMEISHVIKLCRSSKLIMHQVEEEGKNNGVAELKKNIVRHDIKKSRKAKS